MQNFNTQYSSYFLWMKNELGGNFCVEDSYASEFDTNNKSNQATGGEKNHDKWRSQWTSYFAKSMLQ